MAGNVTSLFRSTTAHSPSMAALAREGGGSGPVDFCIPCNPYFPTPAMFDDLRERLHEIITYYPSSADTITAELCGLLQLPPQAVAMGNGSTELITWIDHLLVRESLAVPVPTFGRWTDQPMETGKRVDMFPLQESDGFALDLAKYAEFIRRRGTRTAVICNPNNPDGGFLPRSSVVRFMDEMADLDLIVIDESFLEFADAEAEPSVVQEAMLRPNVIVLRSLGKNFGLHGIRFGYLVANPSLAGRVRSMLPKWNLNSFAEHVVFMLKHHGTEYAQSLRQVRRDRLEMASQLCELPGLTVYPSQGNFLFVRLPVGAEGTVVRDRLLTEHRVLVRECGNKIGSSSRFLRLVVRPQDDVHRLVSGLAGVLYGPGRGAAVPEHATGTGYSSGTALVERLVSETNGAGMRGLADRAVNAGAAASAPALPTGGGSVVVQAALAAQAQAQAQAHAQTYIQGQVQAQPGYAEQQFAQAAAGDRPDRAPGPGRYPEPEQLRAAPAPVPEPYLVTDPYVTYGQTGAPDPMTASGPLPMIDPMTASGPLPVVDPMTASGPLPMVDPAVPAPPPAPPRGPVGYVTGRTPPGVPAGGGLTAAQVRGATSPAGMAFPIPVAGQSWPDAAGMGRAG
ncbi:pyridoxal phosphate-dependent aminotransferase [Streptomyces sp. NPDC090306]|uniref:pyridoxal phosphate-dependent aminotransferase n=1 Tax=Streptomyces sp. NPDC090306 TaxID=3365961 RepID=UPI003815C2ED